MSQQTIPECVVGLTSADLSAWRDETLSADEAARIDAHHTGCLACQERLQSFKMIAAALHSQQAPVPDERLWQSVLAAIAASQPPATDPSISRETTDSDASGDMIPMPQPHERQHTRRRRLLGTLAAVAAIALVVVGFGRVFQIGAGIRQSQTFSVKWRQLQLPGNLGANLSAGAGLGVFSANGSIAWVCVPDQSGTKPPALYRTSDGGLSWQGIAPPDVKPVYACSIQLDRLDSRVAVLALNASKNASAPHNSYQATLDGGVSWQDGSSLQSSARFATLYGATYALRPIAGDTNHLMVSADKLKTWIILDATIHNQKLRPTAFWLNPNTGKILVQAISMAGDGVMSLWTADGKSANWRKLDIPFPFSDIAVASLTPEGQDWNICALRTDMGGQAQVAGNYSSVACGPDARGDWVIRRGIGFPRWPGGATPTPCDGCNQTQNTALAGTITLVGIANDGALLATAEDRFDAKGQATRTSLYRLRVGASVWQSGGALPTATALYTPRIGGGMLWSMPLEVGVGGASGPVFTANYPFGENVSPLPTQAQQTATPAGNIDQGSPLAWQPINQPGDFRPRLTESNILAVAPSDGRTAYACSQPGRNQSSPPPTSWAGWVTHDSGATWSPLALPQVAGWCSLVVDQTNPRDVLMGFTQNPPPSLPNMYYRSTDGGATWRQIRSLDESLIYQFATQGSSIYALRDATPNATNAMAHLQVSVDGMATWTDIESNIRGDGLQVTQFWLNPYNGVLLTASIPAPAAGTPSSSSLSVSVWRSSDGGAHWRNLQASQFKATTMLVQPPQPNHIWGICVASGSVDGGSGTTLICGDDSGQTWRNMPALDFVGNASTVPTYTAFTSDGAILAIRPATIGSGAVAYNIFRLPSGASRWQSLGATPEFSLVYAPTSDGDGMLWSSPVNGIITDAQGRVFRVVAP